MNSLIIYTRSYINEKGEWVMNEALINQMNELFKILPRHVLNWCVLISGLGSKSKEVTDKYMNILPSRTLIRYQTEPFSASEARSDLISFLSNPNESTPYDYYLNIDSDDEIADLSLIEGFVKSNKLDADLLGFGLNLVEGTKLPERFNFSEENLLKYRRYITEESQCMFLFIHSRKVLLDIWINSWVTALPKSDPNESLEDLRLAIKVARSERYKISTICANLINYIESPNQVSNNQELGVISELHRELKKTKQLYANYKHYKYDKNNNLIEWNPYGK